MRTFLSIAIAALLTGGSIAVAQAEAGAPAAPTAYAQMNSPGDGLSPRAARQGNGRPNRMRGMRYRGRHWHHRRWHRRYR